MMATGSVRDIVPKYVASRRTADSVGCQGARNLKTYTLAMYLLRSVFDSRPPSRARLRSPLGA
jgi:hypothetical protein